MLFRGEEPFLIILNAAFREDSACEMAYLLIYQLVKKYNENMNNRL